MTEGVNVVSGSTRTQFSTMRKKKIQNSKPSCRPKAEAGTISALGAAEDLTGVSIPVCTARTARV